MKGFVVFFLFYFGVLFALEPIRVEDPSGLFGRSGFLLLQSKQGVELQIPQSFVWNALRVEPRSISLVSSQEIEEVAIDWLGRFQLKSGELFGSWTLASIDGRVRLVQRDGDQLISHFQEHGLLSSRGKQLIASEEVLYHSRGGDWSIAVERIQEGYFVIWLVEEKPKKPQLGRCRLRYAEVVVSNAKESPAQITLTSGASRKLVVGARRLSGSYDDIKIIYPQGVLSV